MKMKKLTILLITVFFIISMPSCSKNEKTIEETTLQQNQNIIEDEITTETKIVIETTVEKTTEAKTTTPADSTTKTTETITESETKQKQFSINEIVDIYKAAATKANDSIKSSQKISLNDISVNNGEGAINGMLKLVKPIISKVIESNSTEFDGITGGYTYLHESDIQSASAYNDGNIVIIKMTLKEQTDGIGNDKNSGTVGHGISVIGDISFVLGQMSDAGLPIEIPDNNIMMTYTEPEINVVIDSNGNILNGTWKYNVALDMTDFTVAGSTVEKTSVSIENIITVNGGFSE